jgi:polyvinyl alcohol dehydrogenase (cytochrome)
MFVGGESGDIFALDAKTGCTYGTFHTRAGIRTAPSVGPYKRANGSSGFAVFVADGGANAYAVDTESGQKIWSRRMDDAVVAFDMGSGKIVWTYQQTMDVWVGGCKAGDGNPNCPTALGPDHDFSMSPVLAKRSNGSDILIVQQKSGMVYAIDPDKDGAFVWQYKTSDGSGLGGQWGAASDGRQVYFSVNGPNRSAGGMRAVNLDTGAQIWTKDAEPRLCGTERGCSQAQGAAVTAIPGIVFAVSMDGGIRAHAADDGTVVWQFDTNQEFPTVNGVKAKGGAIDGPGVVVAGGLTYVNSGYVSLIGRPGNVLLAFGVE